MGAISVPTHSVLGFTNFSANLGKHASLRLGALGVEENRKVVTLLCCIGSDGNRRGRPSRRFSERTSNRGNDNDDDDDGDEKTNQEELISIFKRIQTSISNEDSSFRVMPGSDVSEKKKSPASSILNVLRRAGNNQGKGNNTKPLMRKRVVPKIEQKIIEDYPPRLDSNLTRPFSKFMKRSPIPYPPKPRKISLTRPDPNIEGMKLVELKELAKSRGIKGYSKLKKSELIDLLLRSDSSI